MRWSEEQYANWLREQENQGSTDVSRPERGNTPDQAFKRLWREWERSVATQFNLLAQDTAGGMGIYVVQAGAPNERVKTSKGIIAVETAPGPPDFVGFWAYGPVAIDAKVTGNKTRFRFTRPSATNRGNWHQYEYMRYMHEVCDVRMRPVAGVFIHSMEHARSFWADITWFNENGSISFDECRPLDTVRDIFNTYI